MAMMQKGRRTRSARWLSPHWSPEAPPLSLTIEPSSWDGYQDSQYFIAFRTVTVDRCPAECLSLPLWTTLLVSWDVASSLLMFLSRGSSSASSIPRHSQCAHPTSFKKSTLVRTVIIKKSTNSKCWRGCGRKRKPSSTVGGNVSWLSHCGKPYGGSSETKTIVTEWPSDLIPGHISRQTLIWKDTRTLCSQQHYSQ